MQHIHDTRFDVGTIATTTMSVKGKNASQLDRNRYLLMFVALIKPIKLIWDPLVTALFQEIHAPGTVVKTKMTKCPKSAPKVKIIDVSQFLMSDPSISAASGGCYCPPNGM